MEEKIEDLQDIASENGEVAAEKYSTIARCIRGRRAALGWTVTDLAKKAGIGRNTVWAIEKSKYNIRVDMLEKIIKALDLHLYAMDENGEFNHLFL